MASHPHPSDVPGLEKVLIALQQTERVNAEGPEFQLCICDADRQIIAVAPVSGFDRVKAFSRAMARLGFAAQVLGDPRVPCDVIYAPAEEVRDIFDDGGHRPAPHQLLEREGGASAECAARDMRQEQLPLIRPTWRRTAGALQQPL
jgi:hypothetical protein